MHKHQSLTEKTPDTSTSSNQKPHGVSSCLPQNIVDLPCSSEKTPLRWQSCVACGQHTAFINYAPKIDAKALNAPFDALPRATESIQMSEVFEDSKTFVDSELLSPAQDIDARFERERQQENFLLKDFIANTFELPQTPGANFNSNVSKGLQAHINTLWNILSRQPGDECHESSLLALPKNYIVPGGRFREIYYWDSYFTMLGLKRCRKMDLVENMVVNFAHLIDEYGFIPNGNRSYYLSRSQPPFFSLMVNLLAQEKGAEVLQRFLPQLEKEYAFWMDGEAKLSITKPSYRRTVLVNGAVLNRHWDDAAEPRLESFREDIELVDQLEGNPLTMYRDIRAAAESGWDFSSRWFADQQNMASIETTNILPIDLNANLHHHEMTLARAYLSYGATGKARAMVRRANTRKKAIHEIFWSEEKQFFFDYHWVKKQHTPVESLAAMYPLYFRLATTAQANTVATRVREKFLRAGGLITTLNQSGQQWDQPNGWAPLHWVSVNGLRNYQQDELAQCVRDRWVALNEKVFLRTGKLLEKYNVEDMALEGGGGEYPVQDGFGWTNGVLMQFLEEMRIEQSESPNPKQSRATCHLTTDMNGEIPEHAICSSESKHLKAGSSPK